MDVMSLLFRVVEERGALADLRPHGIRHLVSLYANDVVIFARPGPDELRAVRLVLATFGGASGQHVNYAKSLALLIWCSQEVCDGAAAALACPIGSFSPTYLGLPLSIAKLRKHDVQLILDKLANKLSFWKAHLMSREGRVAYARFVMMASVIYQLMALDMDPWVRRAIDKTRRPGLHVGRKGRCLGRTLHCCMAQGV
jgi:hypothetical protein